jgi:hypothetical protein
MIRTQAELDSAIQKGAIEIELQATEALRIDGLTRPVRLVGEIAPAALPVEYAPILFVTRSAGLTVDGVKVTGQAAGAGFNGNGVQVADSRDITVRGAYFSSLYRAAMFERVVGLVLERNDVVSAQSEGFNFAACSDGRVTENAFSDFRPQLKADGSGDHPDAIQFWTQGQTTGCSNFDIVSNIIRGNRAEPPQGIWVTSQNALRHKSIRIRANTLLNGLWNGISLGGVEQGEIIGNLLAFEEGVTSNGQIGVVPRIRIDAAPDAIVQGNVAAAYVFEGKPWDYVPAGNEAAHPSTPAQLEALWQRWRLLHRSAAPPVPAPAPKPVDVRALAKEARDLINQAENAMGRALSRLDKIEVALAPK